MWLQLIIGSTVVGAIITAANAYLLERSKGGILVKIEKQKAELSQEIERYRSELGSRAYFRQQLYVREYEAFQRIWPSIAEVRDVVVLYEKMRTDKLIGITDDKRAKMAQDLSEKISDPMRSLRMVEPFLSSEMLALLQQFLSVATSSYVDMAYPALASLRDREEKNEQLIHELSEKIRERIRSQLEGLGDTQSPDRPAATES